MANGGFKERKRRLAGALRLKHLSVENSHIAHFEFGMVKNGYIWSL